MSGSVSIGMTLKAELTRVKLPSTTNTSVVYRIPLSCGKVNIRETKWRLETRTKKHRNALKKREIENLPSLSMHGTTTISD